MGVFQNVNMKFVNLWDENTIEKELRQWAQLVNCGNDVLNKECENLFKMWIQKLQASGDQNIVFMDEIFVKPFCNKNQFNQYRHILSQHTQNEYSDEKPFTLQLNLSYLTDTENVRLMICFSPYYQRVTIRVPFELTFNDTDHHKHCRLVARYRYTRGILDFINLIASSDNRFHQLSKRLDDKSFSDEDLPSPLLFLDNWLLYKCKPVIWINDLSVAESVLDELMKSFEVQELLSTNNVVLLYEESDKNHKKFNDRRQKRFMKRFENHLRKKYQWQEINSDQFHGCESDVLIYVTQYQGEQSPIQANSTRARKLLIILDFFNTEKNLLHESLNEKVATFFFRSEFGYQIMRSDELINEQVEAKPTGLLLKPCNTPGILEFIQMAGTENEHKQVGFIPTENLPSPFSSEKRTLNGCRPVIFINESNVAEFVLDELITAKEVCKEHDNVYILFTEEGIFKQMRNRYSDVDNYSTPEKEFNQLTMAFANSQSLFNDEYDVVVLYSTNVFENASMTFSLASMARKLFVIIDVQQNIDNSTILNQALNKHLVTLFSKSEFGDHVLRTDNLVNGNPSSDIVGKLWKPINTHGILDFIELVGKEHCISYHQRLTKVNNAQSVTIEDLTTPLSFSDKNKLLVGCKSVIWIQNFIVAETILEELQESTETEELGPERSIAFLHDQTPPSSLNPVQRHNWDSEELDQIKRKFDQWKIKGYDLQHECDVVVYYANLKLLNLYKISKAKKLLVIVDEENHRCPLYDPSSVLSKGLEKEWITCFFNSKSRNQIMRADKLVNGKPLEKYVGQSWKPNSAPGILDFLNLVGRFRKVSFYKRYDCQCISSEPSHSPGVVLNFIALFGKLFKGLKTSSEHLPTPLSFSKKNQLLKGNKPVVYMNLYIAEVFLDELQKQFKSDELEPTKSIAFLDFDQIWTSEKLGNVRNQFHDWEIKRYEPSCQCDVVIYYANPAQLKSLNLYKISMARRLLVIVYKSPDEDDFTNLARRTG